MAHTGEMNPDLELEKTFRELAITLLVGSRCQSPDVRSVVRAGAKTDRIAVRRRAVPEPIDAQVFDFWLNLAQTP